MSDVEARALTAQDLLDMPKNDHRYELINGELIEMPPTGDEHGVVESNTCSVLWNFVRKNNLGRIKTGEVGFRTRGDERTVRAADVAFTSYASVPKGQTAQGFSDVPPELVVEIISPNDRAEDIERKTQEWLDFGVKMVLNLYPQAQRAHVFRPNENPRILSADDLLDGGDVLPDFSVRVSAFFED